MKKLIFFVFLCLALFYCLKPKVAVVTDKYYVDKLGDSDVDWLFYSDSEAHDSGEGIIHSVEFVGYNNEFIIVESSFEKFYIIHYKKNKKPYFDKKILIGPLNKKDFLNKKTELNLNNIEFTIYP